MLPNECTTSFYSLKHLSSWCMSLPFPLNTHKTHSGGMLRPCSLSFLFSSFSLAITCTQTHTHIYTYINMCGIWSLTAMTMAHLLKSTGLLLLWCLSLFAPTHQGSTGVQRVARNGLHRVREMLCCLATRVGMGRRRGRRGEERVRRRDRQGRSLPFHPSPFLARTSWAVLEQVHQLQRSF